MFNHRSNNLFLNPTVIIIHFSFCGITPVEHGLLCRIPNFKHILSNHAENTSVGMVRTATYMFPNNISNK